MPRPGPKTRWKRIGSNRSELRDGDIHAAVIYSPRFPTTETDKDGWPWTVEINGVPVDARFHGESGARQMIARMIRELNVNHATKTE